MTERRVFFLDGFALGFLLVGGILASSLLSHDRSGDPTSANLLGEVGRGLAVALVEALGTAAYVLLLGFGLLAWQLVFWRRWSKWFGRALGWLVLVPAAAVAIDRLVLAGVGDGALALDSGGTIGAWLSVQVEDLWEPTGQTLLLVGVAALGLLLAVDFVVLPALYCLIAVARGLVRLLGRLRYFGATPASEDKSILPRKRRAPVSDDDIPIVRPDAKAAMAEVPDEEIATATALVEPALPPLRIARPGPVPQEERFEDYQLPPLALLEEPQPFPYEEHDQHLRDRAALLEKTFADFELNVHVVGINTGPVITQYEVALETGLRVHKVTCLADDLALNLKVTSVRMVAPIPGKNTVGIEIPNEHRAIVRLKEVLLGTGKKMLKARIPLFLGKDTEGRPFMQDLAEMPHLLLAGRTGTGKSVCLNSIILSMLMTRRPDELKMILIDPKRTELIEYGRMPHLMHPVVTDAKKAEAILAWAVDKMEERYDLLSRCRVRNIAAYNELTPAEIHRRVQAVDDEERARIPARMPYVVLIVDELGDLMMQMKREIEGHIIRLAQKSRAAGIHLIVATQKPTVDVITGLIKSNLPARICFQVSSRSDSRVVLDEMGGDKLLGKGDMLFLQPGTSTLIRCQGAFASDQEITRVVEHLDCDPCFAQELLELKTSADGEGGTSAEALRARDAVYEQAISVVIREGRGSVSLLQRSLGIGYGRAARLIDFMAEDGIVGAYNGSNAREVLYTPEAWEQRNQNAAS
jgi:S-DNA-T family DNA segregation ATPase FtsK/SpoIIIE